MGFVFPEIEKDADFDSLRARRDLLPQVRAWRNETKLMGTRGSASLRSEFDAVLKKFAENQKPIGHSETAFTVHEKGLVPEGLAYDPETKTFFSAAFTGGKLSPSMQRVRRAIFPEQSDGLWSVMGMKVDPKRRLLWGSTAGHLQMANAKPEDDGKTAVFKYDLTQRKVDQEISRSGRWAKTLVRRSRARCKRQHLCERQSLPCDLRNPARQG